MNTTKMSAVPSLVVRSCSGITLVEGPESYKESTLHKDERKSCRNMLFSPTGTYFAWTHGNSIEIVKCSDWSSVAKIQGTRAAEIKFSPRETYFMAWETFIINKEHPQGKANLHIYKTATGELVHSFVQKNQLDWEPQWTGDEKLFARLQNSSVFIYEDAKFDRYTQSITCGKVASFSLAPNKTEPYHFAVFIPGKSGQPCFGRVLRYPDLGAEQAVCSRTFFQAERADFYWNKKGLGVLIMTMTEVDKSGGSYYGKQALHYADVKGTTSVIQFSKEGPIYAVSWNPGNSGVFCAVYGHQPARATLFNAKCEALFEFGTAPRNSLYFSPDGTLFNASTRLLFGGFGNIAHGTVEVWDTRNNTRVGSCRAPDTTRLHWDPRAECFLTATTAPRLRVSNGFKIWHYTGALMHERPWEAGAELYDACWQSGEFPRSTLSTAAPVSTVQSSVPAPSAEVYRPPGAKGRPSTFRVQVEEAPHRPGQPATPSKAAIKQRENRENRKAKKAEEKAALELSGEAPAPPAHKRPPFTSTGDPDKDKKIKNINKKLDAIDKLKEMKAAGKPLEINQKAKIESEKDLLQELAQLRL